MPLISVFAKNILPVLVISGAGFALGKVFHLESRSLGKILFFIFSPLLVFDLLTSASLPFDRIGLMMGFTAVSSLVIAGIAFLVGKALHLEKGALIVVVLTSMFMNAGNFGLPLVSFAFGQQALAYASVYFVTNTLLLNTAGVFFASMGNLDIKKALLGILKVPAIYAILAALVFIRTGWKLPEPIARAVSLGSAGAIPGMLILLGLELTRVEWTRNMKLMIIPVFLRLVVSPLLGILSSPLFGLTGPAYQASMTENGTPSAVMVTVLAEEYNLDSSLVTAVIFISTILCPLTLTPLLYFLGK